MVKMRRLLIDAYSWDYTGQQADDSDDEEFTDTDLDEDEIV